MFELLSIPRHGPEISDRIVAFDPLTLERSPVLKREVTEEFLAIKNQRAARIVAALPQSPNGDLDAAEMDQLLIRVHCEMQRMSEEFQHGRRVSELLRPLLHSLRSGGSDGPIRIVDIGCGTGFVIRWLAVHAGLGEAVELIGADYNAALVNEAQRLARIEDLSCRFVVANAFGLEDPATIFISTGVLHHFRGDDLLEFFRLHNRAQTAAFVHFDFRPSPIAPFGSWLFHLARMREPLARHDGVLSAVRAHQGDTLLHSASEGAPDFTTAIYGTRLWGLPIPRVFHALVGVRPEYLEGFIAKLGSRINSLGRSA